MYNYVNFLFDIYKVKKMKKETIHVMKFSRQIVHSIVLNTRNSTLTISL